MARAEPIFPSVFTLTETNKSLTYIDITSQQFHSIEKTPRKLILFHYIGWSKINTPAFTEIKFLILLRQARKGIQKKKSFQAKKPRILFLCTDEKWVLFLLSNVYAKYVADYRDEI